MDVKAKLSQLKDTFREELGKVADESGLNDLKGKYLGKSRGAIQDFMAMLKEAPKELKRELGQGINQAKQEMTAQLEEKRKSLKASKQQDQAPAFDPTFPGRRLPLGHLHPITQSLRRMTDIFLALGYSVAEGPEVETEEYNFARLNFPEDHPSRDMQDTFYMQGGNLLRTHTSPVQIRTMLKKKPPIKMICPGRVFRKDDDASHSPMFFQIEGLVVDKGIHFGHLKGTLETLMRKFYGPGAVIRMRPSFFPFTEPSAEVDVRCVLCQGDGCSLCKQTGWMEILGCGMVHPQVLRNVDIDPEEYSGFAFGLGVDRIAMIGHGIDHIRHFYENDLRFLTQF